MKNENAVDKKVNSYIDNLFSGVGPTQQLFELKEELAVNIKEKIADYITRGMDEDQAFKESVISMGDLGGLVEDMRKLGQDTAKQSVYSSMTARISTAGIITGVLLVLFGIFMVTMLYFMPEFSMPRDGAAVAGNGIFIVAGGAVITYSLLTRETRQNFAMNRIRAAFYALSIGLILFSLFTAVVTRFATGEIFIAVASLMIFFLIGIGLLLYLVLTEKDRSKISN